MILINSYSWRVDWFQVWADYSLRIPYVLLLCRCSDSKYRIINPSERNKIEQEYSGCLRGLYRAKEWLAEDGYEIVCSEGQ
jgi:hypothetical protein